MATDDSRRTPPRNVPSGPGSGRPREPTYVLLLTSDHVPLPTIGRMIARSAQAPPTASVGHRQFIHITASEAT
jgi:hypothetical protein